MGNSTASNAEGRFRLPGEEPISHLVAVHPELELALLSYGIWTCCADTTSLRTHAHLRGVSLELLLAGLEKPIRPVS